MAELTDEQLARLKGAAQTLDERFVLGDLAGKGGMGEVYAATDPASGERVAVKILATCSAETRRRFAIEAEVLEHLSHPAIVKYIAHGATGDGRPFLAMEWLDGEPLSARLVRGKLDVAGAVALAQRVAEALAVVHAAGVVHRDLKPSNILLVGGEPAQAKVIDFGVARWKAAGTQTRTGVLVGTLGYLSPEQVKGRRDLDGRADLFALGVVLYECLTGTRCFPGDDLGALAALIDFVPPKPSAIVANLPRALDELVVQLLQPNRDDRPADATTVARMLGEAERADPAMFATTIAQSVKRASGFHDASPEHADGSLIAGRYELVRFVAAGGMAEVYEARDRELDTKVALKFMLADDAKHPQYAARFRREIQLARLVTHPNVCRIFDLGEHEGVLFLTMELLHGETLHDRLRRAPMSLAEALPVIEQMVGALAAAHAAGVVHRDFKSSNVILVPDQKRAVVTDFGLAAAPELVSPITHPQTRMLGTPAYMAPEQVKGTDVGPLADIYALGVVMFEMATGKLPFVGEDMLSVAAKRLEGPAPSAREHVTDLDPRWTRAIERCLEREPEARFPHVTDVIAALRTTQKRRWPAWTVPLVFALVVAGAVGGGAYLHLRKVARGLDASNDRALAEQAWRVKDMPAAVGYANRALAGDPQQPLVHLLLARIEYEKGDHAASRAHADEAARTAGTLLSTDDRELVAAYHALATGDAATACRDLHPLFAKQPASVDLGLEVAYACHIDQSPQEAQEMLAALRALPAPASEDPRIDLLAAKIAQRHSRYAEAAKEASTARDRARRLGAPWLEAEAQIRIAWAAHYTDDPNAEQLARDARSLCDSLHDEVDASEALKVLAAVADRHGRLREAAEDDRERLRVALKLHREVTQADLLNTIGARGLDLLDPLDVIGSDYATELDIYTRAHNSYGVALATSDVGTVELERGDYAKAIEQLDAARVAFETQGDLARQRRQLIAMARAAHWAGELDRAAGYLDRAAAIASDDPRMAVRLELERGELALDRGHAADAITTLAKARADALAAGWFGEPTRALAQLARAQLAAGDRAAARHSAEVATSEAATLESLATRLDVELAAGLVGLIPIVQARSDVVDGYRAAGYTARAARAAALLKP